MSKATDEDDSRMQQWYRLSQKREVDFQQLVSRACDADDYERSIQKDFVAGEKKIH